MKRTAMTRHWGRLDGSLGLLVDDGYVRADDVRVSIGLTVDAFRRVLAERGVARLIRPERGSCYWLARTDAVLLLGERTEAHR